MSKCGKITKLEMGWPGEKSAPICEQHLIQLLRRMGTIGPDTIFIIIDSESPCQVDVNEKKDRDE